MAHRTTILFDDDALEAVRELSARLRTTNSQAIRLAVLRYRDQLRGVPPEERLRRTAALQELYRLSEGTDVEAEIARLKAEDEHF